MPLVSKTFSQIITFTRASSATYFDATGTLQTATTDAPRFDYNPSTLAAQGFLIEESRTNLITSSAALPAGVNVTITADAFVAPDGTTTGDQILDNATSGEHYSDSTFTPVAATNYTLTAFIKNIGASSSPFACLRMAGDFSAFVIVNLSTFVVAVNGGANFVSSSVQAVNNGWYRISVTGLSIGTTASVARIQVTDAANLNLYSGTGKGFAVWGRQLEAGAFPTSYIPTTTTAVTRAVDVASVNTLSPWYNATAGTLFTEYINVTTATGSLFAFDDGTANNRIIQFTNLGTTPTGRVVTAGVEQIGSLGAGVVTVNTVGKFAFAYATNDFAVCVNGLAVGTDTSGNVPTGMTTARLGTNVASTAAINGWLRRITYYPRRLSNAELQSITT